MLAQLTVQFDRKAKVAVIGLMQDIQHCPKIYLIDVIHYKLYINFSKFIAT